MYFRPNKRWHKENSRGKRTSANSLFFLRLKGKVLTSWKGQGHQVSLALQALTGVAAADLWNTSSTQDLPLPKWCDLKSLSLWSPLHDPLRQRQQTKQEEKIKREDEDEAETLLFPQILTEVEMYMRFKGRDQSVLCLIIVLCTAGQQC